MHGEELGLSAEDAVNASGVGALSGAKVSVTDSIMQLILSNKYIDPKSLLLPSERPSGGDGRQY